MGVDCQIRLPVDVSIEEAGKVTAVLAGAQFTVNEFAKNNYSTEIIRSARFDKNGLTYKNTLFPSVVEIIIKNKVGLVDSENCHYIYFHYCAVDMESGKVSNDLNPKSTPFWCAVGKRLVQFFGGSVVYCDSGEYHGKNVYRHKRSCPVDRFGRIPQDGKEWQDYQDAIINLKPVSEKELREAWKVCAYKTDFALKTCRYVEEDKRVPVNT